jgi:CIC family chloride channel protein
MRPFDTVLVTVRSEMSEIEPSNSEPLANKSPQRSFPVIDEHSVLGLPWVFAKALSGAIRELELRHAGRTLLLSLAVGSTVGLIACGFFWALHLCESLLLHGLTGYVPLLPGGEAPLPLSNQPHRFVPWALVVIPAVGGLVTGLVGHFLAPEVFGGGGNSYVEAFHLGGVLRRRVLGLKIFASLATLGTGGSGGREGPTMLIGASVGSLISRALRVPDKDRRLLLVAGTAGGLAAMFGTPLGAGLLATEVLYRDDFESDALIPAILSSVTSYSIFRAIMPGEGHLFSCARGYAFSPQRLWLYVLLALVIALAGRLFIFVLKQFKQLFRRLMLPRWATPALGGLLLGALAVAWILGINPSLGLQGKGIGILGSGYGAAQAAIIAPDFMPTGWRAAGLLLGLALVKMVATALTLESGGSAGDFGPSIAIGGLLGGAFGYGAQMLMPSIADPGAYALVGMGAFYGGIAHAPLAALVMVCEMAGSYDLLVPLMLTVGLVYLALRPVSLYSAQRVSRASGEGASLLRGKRVSEIFTPNSGLRTLTPTASIDGIKHELASGEQLVYPVLDGNGKVLGVVSEDIRSAVRTGFDFGGVVIAADVMMPNICVLQEDDLEIALAKMVGNRLHALPVVDGNNELLGLLLEQDITRAYCELQNVPKQAL